MEAASSSAPSVAIHTARVRFTDPALEAEFRQDQLPDQRRQLGVTAVVGSVAYLLTVAAEWQAPLPVFLFLHLLPRLLVLALVPWTLGRARAASTPAQLEGALTRFALLASVAFSVTSFHTTVSEGVTTSGLLALLLTFALFLPLRPVQGAVLGGAPLFLYLGHRAVTGVGPWGDLLDQLLVAVAFLILATFTSARVELTRRVAFANLVRERETRRLAERLGTDFHDLFQRCPAPLAISTHGGQILLLNPRLRRLLRIPADVPAAELQAGAFYRDAGARARFIQSLQGDGQALHVVQMQAYDGTPLEIALGAYPIQYQGHQALVASFSDLSEERRVAETLRAARDQAEAASRLKSQFLAHMSHEIRTPMNGVVGMTSLLSETPLDAEQAQMVDAVASSGRALLRIIDDILDLSKVEAGMLALEPRAFAPGSLVDGVQRTLQFAVEAKQADLRVELDPELPPALVGDEGRLRQILVNLAGNALKFLPPPGGPRRPEVRVRLSAALEVVEGPGLRCEVDDDGIGMSSSDLQRIFQPFVQADASTARRFGGTGLGLAISRGLVELMGGVMGAESNPGRGSKFWFEVELASATAAASTGEFKVSLPPRAGLRVLLVEDNLINQRVAEAMLRRLAVEVEVAGDGQRAQELLRSRSYDLVLMDVELPEMDGRDVTRWLRGYEQHAGLLRTPVIALTAHAFADDRDACLEAGMDDYLAKPVTKRALQDALAQHVAVERVAPQPALVRSF